MFDSLTSQFSQVVKRLRGQARLSEENISSAMHDIRTALLDADVSLQVADEFLQRVKAEAIGKKVSASLNPGQAFVGIVHRQLTNLMGESSVPLRLGRAPSVILACGLQGVGKTTNLAKIANHLKTKQKKRVLLASADIHRKAAIEQLRILAESVQLPYYEDDEQQDSVRRAQSALKRARQELADVLLIDTAGRTVLDEGMMEEIRCLHKALSPSETLFFVDAMQGQDAINVARAFHDSLAITGLVLTKFDGDSRGGSALTAKAVTGQPIKFVGVGEKLDDLQAFHPDRFASRILGMGDIAALAEQVQEKTDLSALRRFDKKVRNKPNTFNLNDQLAQIQQMKKMGGVTSVLDKLPGNMTEKLGAMGADDGREIMQMEAIILSMTPTERRQPDIIKASRKRRIAAGAAVQVAKVNQLLQQHEVAKKMLKRHAKNPLAMMRMMQQFFNG